MFKKLIIAAVLAITPMVLAQDSSAQHCSSGYRAYGAPAVGYHGYSHGHRGHYGRPAVNSFYRYGVPYRSGYGGYGHGGYGRGYGYGGYPYYRSGTTIGVGRGGFSLRIGF